MSDILLTTKDILQKQFKHTFRGYNMEEVDEYLDVIIRDYDAFQKEITFLQSENDRLMTKIDELSRKVAAKDNNRGNASHNSGGVTNFDILKRLSNLEKHVFDSKLAEDNSTTEDLNQTKVISPIKD